MKLYILLVIILTLNNCSLHWLVKKDELIDREYRTSDNTILNYEDAARKYTIDNLDTRYRLFIEIDEPYAIEHVNIEIEEIYKISNIEGIVIFGVNLNKLGNISSFKLLKSAGLGLDESAVKILKRIKFSPGYLAGKNFKTKIIVRIAFEGKERI